MKRTLAAALFAALTLAGSAARAGGPVELLNVSYDPTRELLKAIGDAFAAQYAKDGGAVSVKQSHGGSGAQARAVIDGLDADVVTLALWTDVEQIHKSGLIHDGWESRFPNHSVPWTSTIIFVVRKGNPKGVKDWPDLVKPGIEIITPSPKTSGNGKLSFLAAWGSVTTRGGSEAEAQKLVTEVYRRVPVLDSGARGSTTTFAQKQIGDVHLTWENEAWLEVAESAGALEIVYPPVSILAEPPVAIVDENVKRKQSAAAAQAYLEFLYGEAGQEIIARNFYRPIDRKVLERHKVDFPDIRRFPVTAIAKDWADVNERFFADGKVFDEIYRPAK